MLCYIDIFCVTENSYEYAHTNTECLWRLLSHTYTYYGVSKVSLSVRLYDYIYVYEVAPMHEINVVNTFVFKCYSVTFEM